MKMMKLLIIILISFITTVTSLGFASTNQAPRKDVAFVLVYMSTCPHCQRFDPILKQYVVKHKIPVLAYTLNGISLPSFKDSITPTQAEINKLFPDGHPVVPTLFVVDKKRHQLIRAIIGEASYAQLRQRMIRIEDYMLHQESQHV